MPAASTLAAIHSPQRDLATLLVIELLKSDDTTVTLRLGTRTCTAPDGHRYFRSIADPGVVAQPGSYMTSDMGLCSCNPVLDLRAHARAGLTVGDHFTGDYIWLGSPATMYVWEVTTDELVQTIRGHVQDAQMENGRVTLALRQRVDWNGPISPFAATRKDYVNLPEETANATVPIILGAVPAMEMLPPLFTSDYPVSNGIERVRGGKRVAKGLLVDAGRAEQKARVIFAAHKLAGFADQSVGCSVFMEVNGVLVPVKPPGYGEIHNDTDGAWVDIPDKTAVAYYPVFPNAIDGSPRNEGENIASLLDPWNGQSYCRLVSQPAGVGPPYFRNFKLFFPSTVKGGTLVSAKGLVCIRSSTTPQAINYFAYWSNGATGANVQVSLPHSQSSPYVVEQVLTVGTSGAYHLHADNWDTEGVGVTITELNTGSPPYGSNDWAWLETLWIGMELCFIPDQMKVGTERTVMVTRTRPTGRVIKSGGGYAFERGPYQVLDTLPAEQEVRGKFYANVKGAPDDGSGTFTGTPNTLIERAPDLVRYLLQTYGGQTAANIELAAGALGSFMDARTALRTRRQNNMVFGMSIADTTDVMTALAWLSAAAGAWTHLDPSDDKFKMVVWQPDPAVTRATPIKRSQFIGTPRVALSPTTRLSTAVRIPYGYDESTGSYAHETYVAPDRSCAGYAGFNIHDQSLAIVHGASDKLDLTTSPTDEPTGSNTTVDLAAGDHTFQTLMQALHDGLRAANVFSYKWSFGFGGHIEWRGHLVDFSDGTGTHGGGLSTYGTGAFTMEQVAEALQATMNANSGGGYVVSYSRATRKFTIWKQTAFTMLFASGANYQHNCAAALGMTCTDHAGGFHIGGYYTVESDVAIDEELFILTASNVFRVLWRTGPNGSILNSPPHTAHEVLGFSPYTNTPSAMYALGSVPKGVRQTDLLRAARRYASRTTDGPAKRETVVEGRAIFDTDTAVETRNRMADCLSRPHVVVSGTLEQAFGLRRGEVVTFDDDMATVSRYCAPDSDGLWAGKKFYVVEAHQHQGPTHVATEIVTVSA